MMYPYMTLNDDTEITHSEMKADGRVKVYIETPDETGGFHHAICWLPDYTWENHGYSEAEMKSFKKLVENNAHLIMEFSQKGGFQNKRISKSGQMALVQKNIPHTINEIYALPDGQRAELIDGDMYMMAPPNRIHQELVMELSATIRDYIKSNDGSCKVYPAPFAVFLNADDENYVEPDISVICDRDKLNDKGCSGAPDWIIEVVSPASKRMDYIIKLFKYLMAGVREYWIVDSEKNCITVYDFINENGDVYSFTDNIPCNIYDGLKIDFSEFTIE